MLDRAQLSLPEIVLRVCWAVRCLALGQVYLWSPLERDSDIFGWLLFDLSWPESVALAIDNVGMAATCVTGLVGLVVPLALSRSPLLERWRRIEVWLLLLVVAWELLLAICLTVRGGRFLSELTLLSHGLRIGVPLALLLVDRAGGGAQLSGGAEAVLRWATALTFLAHGWQACRLSPEFTSMVITGWPARWFGAISQQSAERMLRLIGATDIVAAVLVVLVRWPWVALYMAVWGVISAVGRTLGVSEANYPETLLRLVHAGGPLTLFLEWRKYAAVRYNSSPSSVHDT